MELLDTSTERNRRPGSEPNGSSEFYRSVIGSLTEARIPFLVGGSFALAHYMHLDRHTKDLDLFVERSRVDALLECLRRVGYRTELSFPHWLAKIYHDPYFIDVVFNSGNGICVVDASWFEYSVPGTALDLDVNFCAPEELIWTKAFIMERERYDGADINHLLRAYSGGIDWQRLLARFGPNWQVLLSHLILFLFVYPGERAAIPSSLMRELLCRMRAETKNHSSERVCNGTLLSRSQYRIDTEVWSYRDARLPPTGHMSAADVASWTEAATHDPHTP